MTEEDKFVNAIKDCWIGKRFKANQMSSLALDQVIKIVNDTGDEVTYVLTYYCSTTNRYSITRRTFSKEWFKDHMLKNKEFIEIKND
jgi:hypothetical protein